MAQQHSPVAARAVSITEVARRAGVAVGTVSNVLNHPERVAPAKREMVLKIIREVGFVRNDAARQLRAGQSRTIGQIVLDAGNPFFMDVARGAEDEAMKRGNLVLLGNSGHDAAREARHIDSFEQQRVLGLLISPVDANLDRLDALRNRGVVPILVDRKEDPEKYSSVAVDDVAGGYLAARHLIDQGRRRLAYVSGPVGIHQVADRLAGAQAAVAEFPGVTLEVLERDALTVIQGRAAGEHLVERGRAQMPDGIFCANDLLALGVLQALTMLRTIRVPEDVALVGYDDIDFASSAVVPLTSVRQPTELLGRTAVELLCEEVDTPGAHRQVVFKPELVVRGSSVAQTPTH
ncbi:LacI family DNA-binding transcriptional regulator [Arthrobacter sp. HY1533]|uniref:LacI family DNA-binding transcriptional regulator n=1 Tax=Arthrobacter sp. HY1533 TaxID=2970919 RepID=UPI0022BA0344|nr:LacI family DNA-binding transcriptional regulator [Arthrobacter sp. HY1533]